MASCALVSPSSSQPPTPGALATSRPPSRPTLAPAGRDATATHSPSCTPCLPSRRLPRAPLTPATPPIMPRLNNAATAAFATVPSRARHCQPSAWRYRACRVPHHYPTHPPPSPYLYMGARCEHDWGSILLTFSAASQHTTCLPTPNTSCAHASQLPAASLLPLHPVRLALRTPKRARTTSIYPTHLPLTR